MRILVVDDSRDTADAVATALRLLGHDAYAAYSEREAEGVLARALGFDAYAFDLELRGGPPVAGALMLERLRAGGDHAPAAIITAHGPEMVEAARLRCRNLGRVCVLRKPFDVADLVAQLERLRGAPHSTAPAEPTWDVCPACGGAGSTPSGALGGRPRQCRSCDGRGLIKIGG